MVWGTSEEKTSCALDQWIIGSLDDAHLKKWFALESLGSCDMLVVVERWGDISWPPNQYQERRFCWFGLK